MAEQPAEGLFGQAQLAFPFTHEAVEELQALVNESTISSSAEPNSTASFFAAAQGIIQSNVGTEVIYITIDGFDTHADQPLRHHQLLSSVSEGIAGMFRALDESGHADRTIALVISEFGRRVVENGSHGTDHGKGGLSLLIGPGVSQSVVLGAPDLLDLDDGDLRVTIDARHAYRDVLRWLDAPDDVATDVLGGNWDQLHAIERIDQ